MSDASKKDWQNPDYRKRQQDADQRPDVRRKRSKARLGANNPRWKGGRRSEAEAFRRTKAWKVQSNRVQKRDNDTCQSCGRKRGEVKGMGGHHVYPLQDYINDGQDPYEYPDPLVETLCNQCHPSSDAREGLMKCPRPPPGIEPRQGYPRSKLHL
jgi:5-methylcytosine-specific restriction endonuclease McrA